MFNTILQNIRAVDSLCAGKATTEQMECRSIQSGGASYNSVTIISTHRFCRSLSLSHTRLRCSYQPRSLRCEPYFLRRQLFLSSRHVARKVAFDPSLQRRQTLQVGKTYPLIDTRILFVSNLHPTAARQECRSSPSLSGG